MEEKADNTATITLRTLEYSGKSKFYSIKKYYKEK